MYQSRNDICIISTRIHGTTASKAVHEGPKRNDDCLVEVVIMHNCYFSSLFVFMMYLLCQRQSQCQGDECPCVDPPLEHDRFIEQNGVDIHRTLCVFKSHFESDETLTRMYSVIDDILATDKGTLYTHHKGVSSSLGSSILHVSIIHAFNESENRVEDVACDVTMEVVSDYHLRADDKMAMRKRQYYSCPGKCLIIPFIEVPSSILKMWLQIASFDTWSTAQQNNIGYPNSFRLIYTFKTRAFNSLHTQ